MPLVFPMALGACRETAEVLRLSGTTMGTGFSIIALDASGRLAQSDLQAATRKALDAVDVAMSNWRPDSEVSRFNAQGGIDPVPMSPDLAAVMQAADSVSLASEGRFDTTIGPLIELWGFGAVRRDRTVPAAAEIAARKSRSGHRTVLQVAPDTLRKTNADAQLYLAGIGKGYGADHVGRALEDLGITDYMVEIGGDVIAKGLNPDGFAWQIGIETPNPADRGVFDIVALSGMGLATSGDYRNYFERDGRRFSHLIDPTTGYPVVHDTASATVLAENAMMADAWSTAMLILGRERGLAVASAHDIAVKFIDRATIVGQPSFTTYVSPAYAAFAA